MKTKLLIIFSLASIAILFSSFMVREKEETLASSRDYYLPQGGGSFASFVSNLQKMEALIYIPKSKINEAKNLNLTLVSREKAILLNRRISEAGSSFVQVFPPANKSDEASKAVSLNFQNLGMISYVKQEMKSARVADQMTFKWEVGRNFPKVETLTINALKPEELTIKWFGSPQGEAYVPATYNPSR